MAAFLLRFKKRLQLTTSKLGVKENAGHVRFTLGDHLFAFDKMSHPDESLGKVK